MILQRSVLFAGLTVMLVACGAPAPSGQPRDRSAAAPATGTVQVARTITIGQTNAIRFYGPWEFSSTPGGGASMAEVHTSGLMSEDASGNSEPRVARALPSFDDGTITVLPDGRMRTIWKLRPGVLWHDGTPFSAHDVVLSWQIARHPELLAPIEPVIRFAQSVEAVDPLTVDIIWPATLYRALVLGHRSAWLFPAHILGEAFEGDKQAFLALPYFTTEYVNLGPFRLVEFGFGERQVFERFDQYFLGRPKVDTIILQTIADQNALLASLRAGGLDMVSEKTFSSDVAVQLRDEWRATGEGRLYERQDNWLRAAVQFDPQVAQPPELSRDVRVRRGLLYAIDREALREFILPGFADTSADSFMLRTDRRAATIGQPFARYPHDRARGLQELAEAGWQQGPEGRLIRPDGQPARIQLRGFQFVGKEVSVIADFWRQFGIEVEEIVPTPALSRDSQYRAVFPGFDIHDRGVGETILVSFDGRLHATAQNRWAAANLAHYANPALDQAIDRLAGTLRDEQQAVVLAEIGEILATELPALPLYFRTAFAAVRKGTFALDDFPNTRAVGSSAGVMSRNAHLWAKD